MKPISEFIVKTVFILGLILFSFINYRCFSIDKGWSTTALNFDETISAAKLIDSIPTKIEYYEKTIKNNEYNYKIYIETNDKNYLFDATYESIQTFDIIGIFAKDIKPQKITPIPFYIEMIIGFFVLIIPFGKKQTNKDTQNDNITKKEETEQIEKLLGYKKLLDENIITQEEFNKKKKEFLNL